jgi:hypothetical protein
MGMSVDKDKIETSIMLYGVFTTFVAVFFYFGTCSLKYQIEGGAAISSGGKYYKCKEAEVVLK